MNKVQLKNVTTKIGSGATPKGGRDSYKKSGITLIRSMNVFDFKFTKKGLAFIDDKQAEKLKNVTIEEFDILLNITGASVARCCMVPKDLLPARVNQHVSIIRLNPLLANPYYVLNFLNTPAYKQYLLGLASVGATREALTKEAIENLNILLPPLPTQKKIANILSAYDDLIENNNQRIQLLEEMAAEIYKEWFVRFRFPGYESASFVDKEGKEVPQGTDGALPLGWEKVKLTNLAYVSDGTHDSPKKTIQGHYLVTGKNIKNGFINISDAYFISSEDHDKIQKRSFLNLGDIIVSNIGTIGATALIFETPNYSVKNVIILRPLSKINSCYVHSLIKSKYTQAVFQNEMTGASQQFLSLSYMRNFKVIRPENHLLEKFEAIIGEMNNLSYKLYQKNKTLQQTRDLLLPRLISGKLSVENLVLPKEKESLENS